MYPSRDTVEPRKHVRDALQIAAVVLPHPVRVDSGALLVSSNHVVAGNVEEPHKAPLVSVPLAGHVQDDPLVLAVMHISGRDRISRLGSIIIYYMGKSLMETASGKSTGTLGKETRRAENARTISLLLPPVQTIRKSRGAA